jgi:xanthine dehydrogenase/oxidase
LIFFIHFAATGEPGSCVAVVVLFALRHALNSARRGLNDNWYNLGAPTMPEDIFLLASHRAEDYKLK